MTEGIDIDSYEVRRQEIIKLLQTYRQARQNITDLRALAQKELNDSLYPSSIDYSKAKVQSSFNSGDLAESLLKKISTARKYLKETIDELDAKSQKLDMLLLEITKLPAYQGRVIIGLYIDGKSEGDLGELMGKSEETICGYRKDAIARLTKVMTREKIRTWKKE